MGETAQEVRIAAAGARGARHTACRPWNGRPVLVPGIVTTGVTVGSYNRAQGPAGSRGAISGGRHQPVCTAMLRGCNFQFGQGQRQGAVVAMALDSVEDGPWRVQRGSLFRGAALSTASGSRPPYGHRRASLRREWRPCGCSYPASREAIAATCRPWKRAASSSFSLGMRSPEPPAIVEAP